jgi:CRP-like cAMP-binding protein
MNTLSSDLIQQVRDLPLFHGLPAPDLERILQAARTRAIRGGEFYFFQGDPTDRIYALIKGRVRLTKSNPGEPAILLRIIQPVTVFGAIALVQAETYPVSAQAEGDCQALYWIKAEMSAIMNQSPQLALNVMAILAENMQEFQERYQQMATERVERRLARTLIRLASQCGKKTEEGTLINMPITRQDLAEMTGTTLFTVSRTLSQWETQGLVICGRERVVLRYPDELVKIAEDQPSSLTDHDP